MTLYGKMHVGAGLTRFPGKLNAFPFDNPNRTFDAKALREWSRGLGPATNVKGKDAQMPSLNPPSNVAKPATSNDYQALAGCLRSLRGGLIQPDGPAQLLYCSILVPHPPYASNATYMAAVQKLLVPVPAQVPREKMHPNDVSTALLKSSMDTDKVPAHQIEYFRRVYFSMCFEADSLLGQILDALDATSARPRTYVMMVSDHGEDNTEHRQCGKNNMYDSASRVAMLLSGPGIAPGQRITALASLNDVFPTILSMANLQSPDGLAGSSLLPLVNGAGDPLRKPYITAQYHSVFSVTGEFMIRKGDLKLIMYGPNQFDWTYPSQLFNLSADPWELNDIAEANPTTVHQLSIILENEVGDIAAIDARSKEVQRQLFFEYAYKPAGGALGCQKLFIDLYGSTFNETDAAKVEQWLGQKCPYIKPQPDPSCAHGIKDSTGSICCSAQCKICAHPSSACKVRPGGSDNCCPSVINGHNQSCTSHPAPCVIHLVSD